MKKISAISFAAIFIIALALLYRKNLYTENSYTESREAIGTVVSITLYDSPDNIMDEAMLQSICHKLFDEANRLENIFSSKISSSELSNLNNQIGSNVNISVSDELYDILSLSTKYCQLTNGAFDITLGNLINLWNIGTDNPTIPKDSQLAPLIELNRWQSLILNQSTNSISITTGDFNFDLGAIAKGYIGDKLKALAVKNGISSGILSLGGNIITIGSKNNDDHWTVGLTDPLYPDSLIGTLSIKDKSVVTSGNYERYFMEDGVRYHHILNPNTGYPAENGIISSTIIGDSSADCDALSTGCYVLGITNALELIESLDGYEAIFIDSLGNIHSTSGVDAYKFTTN